MLDLGGTLLSVSSRETDIGLYHGITWRFWGSRFFTTTREGRGDVDVIGL